MGRTTRTVLGCPVENPTQPNRSVGHKSARMSSVPAMKTVFGCPLEITSSCAQRNDRHHKCGSAKMAKWKTVLGFPVADESLYLHEANFKLCRDMNKAPAVSGNGEKTEAADKHRATSEGDKRVRIRTTRTVLGCPVANSAQPNRSVVHKSARRSIRPAMKTVFGCPLEITSSCVQRIDRHDKRGVRKWKTALGCP